MPSLNIPWAQWGQNLLTNVGDLGTWLLRYVMYLGQAQQFLAANFPGSNLLLSIEQDLLRIDPNLNLTNVTYAELVNDGQGFYGQFINWYGSFFGTNGTVF